ncbi:MAG: lipoprotein [Ignavibacteria bacterium]|nr:MAG: lipoprotein [Ignavibacteria bacterium]KAF0159849.1 MAG: lipoprotein [Ignavibacteria bacterium]
MKKVIEKYSLLAIVMLLFVPGCSFDNGTTSPTESSNNSIISLQMPKDGTTGISVFGTNLQWSTTAAIGTSFQIFIEPTTGKNVLPVSSSWNTTPKAVGLTSTSYNTGQLTYAAWYAWKVRALLTNGFWTDSHVQYFQTEDIPPSASNILKVYDYATNYDPNNLNQDRVINIILQVTDPAGNGIVNLSKEQFEVLEDGEQLREAEVKFSAMPASRIVMPVSILIDNSTSIKANNRLPQMKTDATEIVARLSSISTLKSYFNIYQFSENLSPQVGTITPPGVSSDQAKLEISNIQNGVASTDLYGAVADVANSMFNSYTVNEVKNHVMVVLSDGDDTAGKRNLAEATNAVAAKRVYTIGYAGDLREDILKMIGVSGYFNRSLNTDFSSYLLNLKTYLENFSKSFYMLTVTSPKRGFKNRTISIRMHGSLYPVSVNYPGW